MVNSNGFLEKGVGIEKFKLVRKKNSAMAIEHKTNIMASKKKVL